MVYTLSQLAPGSGIVPCAILINHFSAASACRQCPGADRSLTTPSLLPCLHFIIDLRSVSKDILNINQPKPTTIHSSSGIGVTPMILGSMRIIICSRHERPMVIGRYASHITASPTPLRPRFEGLDPVSSPGGRLDPVVEALRLCTSTLTCTRPIWDSIANSLPSKTAMRYNR